MDQSELEFLKAFELIKEIVPEPLEYRFHYNENGDIYLCTMQQHPDNTQYIVVTKEEYANYYNYRIVDNKLKLIDRSPKYHVQLKSSNQGYQVVKNHAALVLEPGEAYSDTGYYERIN